MAKEPRLTGFITKGGRRVAGSRKRDARLGLLTDKLMKKINDGARNAAVQVMNDLGEEGPVWSGEFRDSWIAVSRQEGGSVASSGSYPYDLSNVPKLSLEQKEQVKKIEITNTSKWAEYALDLKKGKFTPKNFPRPKDGRPLHPRGDVVETGKRDPDSLTFRGEISGGDGGARITAPLDWYSTYLKGGKFKKALRKGLQMGFKGKK
tara:strand:+ start:41 stop:658 length:618 start_codon:yes stop_codon:yes gene_type:complete